MQVNNIQLAEGLMSEGRDLSMRVTGGSMSPLLRSGDTIYVQSVNAEGLFVGDIILYRKDECMIAHRIVDIRQKGDGLTFLTKGDAFSSPDPPVKANDILGRVYAVKKRGILFDLTKGIFSKISRLAHFLSPLTAALYERIRCYRDFDAFAGIYSGPKEELFLMSLLQADLAGTASAADTASALKDSCGASKCLAIAREHKISQKIHTILKKTQPSDNFMAELRKDYIATATKNTMLYSEFKRVVEEFGERSIAVIAMKGAALAELVYQDIGIREMSDIDLLIRENDLAAADSALDKRGYTPIDATSFDGVDNKNNYLTTRDYRSGNPLHPSFHIHWHIVNSSVPAPYARRIDMDEIWADAVPVEIAGVRVLCMSPHHFLVHLCEHAMRVTHSASKLIFLLDVATLVSAYRSVLEWRKVISTCRKCGLDRFVYNILRLGIAKIGLNVPEWVMAELKPCCRGLGERLFYYFSARGRGFSGLSYLVHMDMNKGIMRKACFIFRTLFPPAWVLAKRSSSSGSGRPHASRTYRLYLYRLKEILSSVLSPILRVIKINIAVIICALAFFGISPALSNDAAIEKNHSYTTEFGTPEYLIAPGDLLEIKVWQGFDVKNYDVVVKIDGFITFGFVNVKVSDLTARQAESALNKALSEYIKQPRLELTVKEFRGRTVTLIGAIWRSGGGTAIGDIHTLRGRTTLSKLIIEIGGFTKDADIENIQITKPDGTIRKVNLFKALLSGDTANDAVIDSGDIINVPSKIADIEEKNVFIFGEVASPGVYKLTPGLTLLQAIGTAKGYSKEAVIEDIRVIRGGLEKPQLLAADIKAMLQKGDLTRDITLQKNDIIYVPRTKIGNWNAFIAELRPTLEFIVLPFTPALEYQSLFPATVK